LHGGRWWCGNRVGGINGAVQAASTTSWPGGVSDPGDRGPCRPSPCQDLAEFGDGTGITLVCPAPVRQRAPTDRVTGRPDSSSLRHWHRFARHRGRKPTDSRLPVSESATAMTWPFGGDIDGDGDVTQCGHWPNAGCDVADRPPRREAQRLRVGDSAVIGAVTSTFRCPRSGWPFGAHPMTSSSDVAQHGPSGRQPERCPLD